MSFDETGIIVEQFIKLHNQIKIIAKKDPRFGIDGLWEICMRNLRCLNPASYGCRAETKIIEIMALAKTNASKDLGDAISVDGKFFPINSHIEIKVSFLNETKTTMDLRQIRLWQKTDYYLCIIVDTNDLAIAFVLTKEDMLRECELVGSHCHGTKKANESNTKSGRSITIECVPENPNYNRWLRSYHRFDIAEILNNCI